MHILSPLIIGLVFVVVVGMVFHLKMCLANFQPDTQACYYQ
jgi:hypothetical protein